MAKPSRRRRRRWESTLASVIAPGHEGQPGHEIGAKVTVIDVVEVPGIGKVSLGVPRPSALLFETATSHMKRAVRLREATKKQVTRGKWVQAGHELDFTNEELVFDFFQEAMARIILAHAALDNLLNEILPVNFVFESEDGEWSGQRIEGWMGVERKVTAGDISCEWRGNACMSGFSRRSRPTSRRYQPSRCICRGISANP